MDLTNDTLVLVPTYNESKNVEDFLNLFIGTKYDVLIIDDNSPDSTGEIVKKFSKTNSNIHLLERPEKLGLGSAYRDGFKWALKKDYISFVEMDADFSHSFSDLQQLVTYKDKFDLVIGSRYITGGMTKGWSRARKSLSVTANIVARTLLGLEVNDMTSGFRIYSRNCLEDINFYETKSNGYAFQIEMTFLTSKSNKSIKEVPITFYERSLGDSKMSKVIVYEAIKYLILSAFSRRS
jgi:dolichol-phosphate mannosyltransferase